MAQRTINTPREETHQRIAVALEDIVDKITDTSDADNINYNNTASGLQATKVQGAIDELASEKADKSTTLAGYGITDAYTKTESDNKYVAKETGKGLSTNDYTTADKNKLTGIEAEANKTVVDSSMSDSSTNPLQNKVITKELEGTKTTSGNPLTVTDAAPVNAVNLSMDLEPIQDLHGYDHPWVGGAGKNKCPAYTSTETQYGVTIAGNSEGEISVNGTLDGTNLYGFILNSSISLGAGTYTLNGANPNGARLVLYDSNDNELADTQDANPTFTLESTTTAVLRIFVYANVQYDEVVRPMIRLSTETDSSFAPYTNICGISGRSEVAINRVGKNLFDESAVTNGKVIVFNTGNIITNDNYYTSDYIPVISGDNYTFSGICLMNSSEQWWYDKDKQPLLVANNNATKTVPNGAYYFRFSRGISDGYVGQIEKGSTATTYEPYAGKTYTIQLGDTIYGGTVDFNTGVMTVTKKFVEYSSVSGTGANSTFTFDQPQNMNADVSDVEVAHLTSDKLKAYSISSVVFSEVIGIAVSRTSNDIYARFPSSYGTTTSDIDAKLAVEPLQIVYELATPFTIDLTPQQIKLLENTNTIYTDYEGDTITLEYQPNNAVGEAVRAVEESYDPEFAVRPVLKKKAFSGTTDSDGAVTLINASDIPSGHKIIPLHITDMTIDGSAGTYFVEYEPYNSGDSVKGYCYFYMSGSQMFPVGKAITGNFYYYDLEG